MIDCLGYRVPEPRIDLDNYLLYNDSQELTLLIPLKMRRGKGKAEKSAGPLVILTAKPWMCT